MLVTFYQKAVLTFKRQNFKFSYKYKTTKKPKLIVVKILQIQHVVNHTLFDWLAVNFGC